MKLIVIVLSMCLLLWGCSESPRNAEGNLMAEKDDHNEFHIRLGKGNGEWYFRYIEVDGHEYLIMTGTHRSGLTHSPKCKCQEKKLLMVLDPLQSIDPNTPVPLIGIEYTNVCTNGRPNNCVTNIVFKP